MILNTGSRTDIPAFFSTWFFNRLREGFVLVRNPYYPSQVTRYRLDPQLIDAMVFCSKNPAPMLANADGMRLLEPFRMFWYVTITPYGPEIEPRVPEPAAVMDSFWQLSNIMGPACMSWRYDPIFVLGRYSVEAHIRAFERMATRLEGATGQCVVSFLDLYAKTRRNFPEARAVNPDEQEQIVEAFSQIAGEHGMQIHLCCENARLARPHVDAGGCLSQQVLERALGASLRVPKGTGARAACPCLLGADIGAYNSCPHGCRYCYANFDRAAVAKNLAEHDPESPFLIGGPQAGDVIHDAKQKSWLEAQERLF